MSGSSDSSRRDSPQADLVFPIQGPAPPRKLPEPVEAAILILEHSRSLLRTAAAVPGFEARRLALKAREPFRILD